MASEDGYLLSGLIGKVNQYGKVLLLNLPLAFLHVGAWPIQI
jgi:hypothetical protein